MAVLKDRDETDFRSHAGMLADALARITPDDRPTVLIAGMEERAVAMASWAERGGLRCVGRVGLDGIADRLMRICALDLILLDLRGRDAATGLDRASARALTARHGLTGTRLAVIVDLDSVDWALALLESPRAEFLCDPADSEIISLLVVAGLRQAQPAGCVMEDASRDSESLRLEQLSEEVRRLATTIERMTAGVFAPFPVGSAARDRRDIYRTDGDGQTGPARMFQPRDRHRGPDTASGPPSHAEIRAMIRARRLRDQYFPADLFADPAWDMILDLMAARLSGQRVSVSSLCIAASVPPTTALRWIRQLTDRAVFARIDDPADGRRVFIELTDMAAQAVSDWVLAVRRGGMILAAAPR
ncbi:MarR family transcriptional regulator [Sphingobium nicotianae]|uniref:MarR family transcriptional regulator n=1 Tax=Sphingobium nicotianae TaxID=2782607 RepID=A0A9X1DEK2_9SPHN|nr:MarR family transcriptional regulator [Sphingobium nicotianae]MBT2188464.1 MarR family transcriptional regulator [Sphingobium nicotianae]